MNPNEGKRIESPDSEYARHGLVFDELKKMADRFSDDRRELTLIVAGLKNVPGSDHDRMQELSDELDETEARLQKVANAMQKQIEAYPARPRAEEGAKIKKLDDEIQKIKGELIKIDKEIQNMEKKVSELSDANASLRSNDPKRHLMHVRKLLVGLEENRLKLELTINDLELEKQSLTSEDSEE